jgi:corrinoid protein of di/trimethylamine methyltransferase
MAEAVYSQMAESVVRGEADTAAALAQEGLDMGLSATDILDKGFARGIEQVGELFATGELFLPELVQGAKAMTAAVAVLEPALNASSDQRKSVGKALACTVAGDVHEIGKTIVCAVLAAAGFEVTDLGCDVSVEAVVDRVEQLQPDLVLLSALLTTTMPNQQKTIDALKVAGLRDSVKVMVGGAPVTRAWGEEIGADGYADDAIEAVAVAKQLMGAD